MTSLADELDLDPAYDNASYDSGLPLSLEANDVDESREYSRSSTRSRRGGRRGTTRSSRRRYSGHESEEAEGAGPSTLVAAAEGFSLADELGGGSVMPSGQRDESKQDFGQLGDDDAIDDETKSRRNQEHYLLTSDLLSESVQQTEAFLDKLRRTSVPSNSVLPSVTSSSSMSAVVSTPDDTARLEAQAEKLLKQMREDSSAREDQVRELQDCERQLRRALEEGGDWIAALAQIDELESLSRQDEDSESLSFIAPAQSSKGQRARGGSIMSGSDLGETSHLSEDDALAHHQLARSPLSPIIINDQRKADFPNIAGSTRTSVCQELASLQQSTSDLVNSLGSIHEQNQVAHASMNDAARRIKIIKTVLTNWNTELHIAEQSHSYINAWESGQIDGVSRPANIREWTQSHLDKFERILNDADVRARELLSPVHDPVLD